MDVKFTIGQSDLNKINHLLEVKDINISIAEMLQYFFKISETQTRRDMASAIYRGSGRLATAI